MCCCKGFRWAIAVAAVFAFVHSTFGQEASLDLSREATIKRVGDEVKFLASDELEGRGIDTKGLQTSAEYIRDEFKKFGLKSGVEDGSYFQPFTVTERSLIDDKDSSCVITTPDGKEIKLAKEKEFQPQLAGGNGDVSGGLVFVGYGIDAGDLGYQEYEGVDVKGKIVIMIRREPQQNNEESKFKGKDPSTHAMIVTKLKVAEAKGAAGILFVNDRTSTNDGKSDRIPFPNQFRPTGIKIPMAFVKRQVIDGILAKSPLKSGEKTFKSLSEFEKDVDESLKPASQELAGYKAAYKTNLAVPTFTTYNVVGVIEGEGPKADETIVIGAHYDHLGYGFYGSLARNRKGEIHNGADDNATGTIAVVELARRFALAKKKPKRRLVFIAFSGEENGLLGSYYYCRNQPLFPLEKTVAMINYDMIGQMKNNSLKIFGGRSAEGLPELLEGASKDTELKLTYLPVYTGGSDHLPFNAKQIPNMFMHTGTDSGLYHTPDDDYETINVEGMVDVIDFSEEVVNQLAKLDKPLEFKAATRVRRRAIGYLGVQPDADSEVNGAYVAKVMDDSPAAKAGLKIGDVIKKIDGKEVDSATALITNLRSKSPGTKVKVTLIRDKKEMTLEVELTNAPSR